MECNIFAHLETHLTTGFSQKTNLNKRSILDFKNFENYVRTFHLLASQPANQPAIRPNCARCRALNITQSNRLLHWIYETVVLKTISYCAMVILLSFLTLLSSQSIELHKQFA